MNKWLALLCCVMLAAAPLATTQAQDKKADDKKQAALAKKKQDEEIQAHMARVTECDKQAKELKGNAHKNFMRRCLNQ